MALAACQPLAISVAGAGVSAEPINPRATRVRVAARDGGLFYDTATASEIVAQTERILEGAAVTKFTAKTRRVSTH